MPGTGGAMGGKPDVELLSLKLRHPEPRPELGETVAETLSEIWSIATNIDTLWGVFHPDPLFCE